MNIVFCFQSVYGDNLAEHSPHHPHIKPSKKAKVEAIDFMRRQVKEQVNTLARMIGLAVGAWYDSEAMKHPINLYLSH